MNVLSVPNYFQDCLFPLKRVVYIIIISLNFFLPCTPALSQSEQHAILEIDSLIALSRQYIEKQKFDQALAAIEAAGQIANHSDIPPDLKGRYLFNHGRALDRLGQLDVAEQQYMAALAIQTPLEATRGEDLAWTLNNLGALYSQMGRYDEAVGFYDKSLSIRQRIVGETHPDYMYSLNNIGNLYERKGDYKKAEKLLLKAKELRALHLGKTHPDYSWSLNDLGVLYKRMGRFQEALSLYTEAKSLRATIYGVTHPNYAVSLNNLANLYLELKRYNEAETLYMEALNIWKEKFGESHATTAAAFNNLAKLKQAMKDYPAAESFVRKSMEIGLAVFGKEHPRYGIYMQNLGEIQEASGQLELSLNTLKEALELRTNIMGVNHQDYASNHHYLSSVYWKLDQHANCFHSLKEVLRIQKQIFMNAATHLSEQEQSAYVNRFIINSDMLYSLALKHGDKVDGIARECLETALFLKGFVLNAAIKTRQQIARHPEAHLTYNQLQHLHHKLNREYAKPIASRNVDSLERAVATIEKKLINEINLTHTISKQVSLDQLKETLLPGEAILEIVHFNLYTPAITDSVHYAAILLRHGDVLPTFIPLFAESGIEVLLTDIAERKADFVNTLYSWRDRNRVRLGQAKPTLYEIFWQPVEAVGLDGITRIYYSPSGLMHRINVNAISLNDEQVLADRFHIVMLGSTRQRIKDQEHEKPESGSSAVVFGGIDFGETFTNESPEQGNEISLRGTMQMWGSLPWTEKEGLAVSQTMRSSEMQVEYYSGKSATEQVFKMQGRSQKSSPNVLHIATHGFFIADPTMNTPEEGSGFLQSANPMMRSGLILSDGNFGFINGVPREGQTEDGVLTALEISQLDLRQTTLTILSACETGLGDIRGNEGVYGLQRAFKIAGSQYLIMSLWQVPDRETMAFMTSFYEHWLNKNMTIPDAFRSTQRAMRDRFYNPYAWAAFVLLE